jgi:hypothetical protein
MIEQQRKVKVRSEACTYIEAPDDGRSTTETYVGYFK